MKQKVASIEYQSLSNLSLSISDASESHAVVFLQVEIDIHTVRYLRRRWNRKLEIEKMKLHLIVNRVTSISCYFETDEECDVIRAKTNFIYPSLLSIELPTKLQIGIEDESYDDVYKDIEVSEASIAIMYK